MLKDLKIRSSFRKSARAVVFPGDCLDLLQNIPEGSIQLIVTSPPYNIGKEYEKKLDLSAYIASQAPIIRECARVLSPRGSLCWQTGNYVNKGSIVPLDTALHPVFDSLGLKMRNRIIWHFEHGLHCSKRFSGRYETIVWLTKSDDYIFHLDPVRIPQKYPGKKHFKGPKSGSIPATLSEKTQGTCGPFPM